MQNIKKENRLQKPLLVSLIGIGFVIMVATFMGQEVVKTVTDITYIPVTTVFVALASILAWRFKKTGSHGKAWLLFVGAATSWFIAETIWTVYDLIYNVNPFPSIADVFYVAGYPFMFGFLIYYLNPVKRATTRKMTVIAVIISAVIAIPSIYLAYSFDPSVSPLENALATTYPIADAILFVPALIGLVLFFRGEVNFTWSLIFIGIFCFTLGDLGFQITMYNNTYYTGHPVDIILMWSYILFSFGAYDHIRIFKKDRIVDSNAKM